MPFPGLLTVILSFVSSSPLTIDLDATIDFLTISIFSVSLGEGFFSKLPNAFSIFRIEVTIIFNSLGSRDAL